MRIWLSSSRQRVAAGTAALTVGLCVYGYRNEFDIPHLHVDDPIMPGRVEAVYAPATNTASAIPVSANWDNGV